MARACANGAASADNASLIDSLTSTASPSVTVSSRSVAGDDDDAGCLAAAAAAQLALLLTHGCLLNLTVCK